MTVALLLLPTTVLGQRVASDALPTVIYFVRHAETDPTPPHFPLNATGQLRARAFSRTVSAVKFTHVFSSHTTRARQMVEPVAVGQGLEITQQPTPGMPLGTGVVSDFTPSNAAVVPLVEALRALPRGSKALVGVNSDNVFAVMNGLGVPVGTEDRPCDPGTTCVPCLTNACAAARFDQMWILVLDPGLEAPVLIELRYGATDD